jgi:lysozyme family protein
MSAATWPTALAAVLKHEGGYVNHPADPGGRTNLGVTQRVWENWTNQPADEAAMRALTPELVAPLYRERYWNAVRADELPAGVDLAVFDCAVNSGPGRAAMLLQQSIGVWPDGVIGPKTMAAIKEGEATEIVDRFCELRLLFLRGLPTWPTFGKGWERRVKEVWRQSRGMAS